MQLFRSITRRHHWLLFIGDSDTRGLVFGLLQLLATAGYGAELASHSRALWLGGANHDSQATSTSRTMLMLGRSGLRLTLALALAPTL